MKKSKNMKNGICVYCGAHVLIDDFDGNMICPNCRRKLPLVRKLVRIFKEMREYYGKN